MNYPSSDEVTPFGVRRPVTQDWVHGLTFMQQSVLLAAVRGPDTVRKDHPVKVLCRWYRRCVLISAFNRTTLKNPYAAGGGSFTGPVSKHGEHGAEDIKTIEEAVELFFRTVDELPHHYTLHLIHAAEIIGYKHPAPEIRLFWKTFYLNSVKSFHMSPESEQEMDKRLGDFEASWAERNVVL